MAKAFLLSLPQSQMVFLLLPVEAPQGGPGAVLLASGRAVGCRAILGPGEGRGGEGRAGGGGEGRVREHLDSSKKRIYAVEVL